MALLNPCNTNTNAVNTGVDGSCNMKATAKLFMLPSNDKFTMADITDAGNFTAYAQKRIHDIPAKRWFPLFGSYAPISTITDGNENDVIQTMDDGSMELVRRGMFSRTFLTTKGGMCFSKKLAKFPTGYSFIEVDIDGKVRMYQPSTGVYGGFPTNLAYGTNPKLQGLKTVFENAFMMNFNPVYYINKGENFDTDGSENLQDLNGLLDITVAAGTQTASTSSVFVSVKTSCSTSDLVALYGTQLAHASNFVVTDAGATVIPSGVIVQNDEMKISGAFTSGSIVTVNTAIPSVLLANGLSGYESQVPATILIP